MLLFSRRRFLSCVPEGQWGRAVTEWQLLPRNLLQILR